MAKDLHSLLGSLHQNRVALDLGTSDLCYLVTLRAQAEMAAGAVLSEEALVDTYLQVCTMFEPDADNPRKRATHAIQRLRDQRLLRRVDGAGLVAAGEYTLTRLATAIVEFFVEDEALTRESLAVLTRALVSHLSEVGQAARRAGTAEDWSRAVIEPLRVTVRDLVSGIERRQRGLDGQQEDVRTRIGDLLQDEWFSAVEECEALLHDTSTTLQELNEVLLRDHSQLQALLQEIEEVATQARVDAAVIEAQAAQEHLDRVAAWGEARQLAWSDYYQFVQRFLRGVVRMDPDRAFSQRLRDQAAGWLDRPFHLLVAAAPAIRVLREDEVAVSRPPMARPRRDREQAPVEVPPDSRPRELEDAVRAALAGGGRTLAEVLGHVLPEIDSGSRYRVVGRVVDLVASRARVHAARERAWIEVPAASLEVEDWGLEIEEGA